MSYRDQRNGTGGSGGGGAGGGRGGDRGGSHSAGGYGGGRGSDRNGAGGGGGSYGGSQSRPGGGGGGGYGSGRRDGGVSNGYGGGSKMNGNSLNKNSRPGEGLRKPRWDMERLQPFEKNFYTPSPTICNRSQHEVDDYLHKNQITMKGRDIPLPVLQFPEAGFPDPVIATIRKSGFENPT